MQTITPFLWFNGKLEEAIKFYTSVFKKSKIKDISRGPKGKIMSATFVLNGQEFMALDGGPSFKFTPAVSFFVECKTQQEVDELWEKLSKGGKRLQCGWVQDKYGLSWQIIPSVLGKYLQDENDEKSERVMEAMLKMKKIDINGLKLAYHQD